MSFVCSGFGVLFEDSVMMFIALTSRKQCYSNGSHFWDDNVIILYLSTLQWSNFLMFEGLEFCLLEIGCLEIKWHFEHMTLSMFGLCICNKIPRAWIFHIQCWIMWWIS